MIIESFFNIAREIAGGKLTQYQVNEIDKLVNLLKNQDKKTSTNGVKLIQKFEGIRTKAYNDGVGICTIGIGTIIYPNGKKVQYNDTCTEEQALEYFHHDLKKFEEFVNQLINVEINQNQFDALVSLTYNIGINAFKNSTLLKKLNLKDYIGAADQFLVWNKAGGNVLKGLVERRKEEKNLFLKM